MPALIWDMDDTLYSLMQPFEKACESLLGAPLENPREAYLRFRTRSDEVFEASERGEMTLEYSRIYRFQKAMEDCGITVSEEKAALFQDDYKRHTLLITLSDAMRAFLDTCKAKKIRLGMITNGPMDHQRSKIEALGLYRWIDRDDILISGEVGFMKPDRRIYDLAAKHMKLDITDTYMIGDKLTTDIEGAMHAGWKTIWFNRNGNRIPEGKEAPTYTVESEEALLTLLYQLIAQGGGA